MLLSCMKRLSLMLLSRDCKQRHPELEEPVDSVDETIKETVNKDTQSWRNQWIQFMRLSKRL